MSLAHVTLRLLPELLPLRDFGCLCCPPFGAHAEAPVRTTARPHNKGSRGGQSSFRGTVMSVRDLYARRTSDAAWVTTRVRLPRLATGLGYREAERFDPGSPKLHTAASCPIKARQARGGAHTRGAAASIAAFPSSFSTSPTLCHSWSIRHLTETMPFAETTEARRLLLTIRRPRAWMY